MPSPYPVYPLPATSRVVIGGIDTHKDLHVLTDSA